MYEARYIRLRIYQGVIGKGIAKMTFTDDDLKHLKAHIKDHTTQGDCPLDEDALKALLDRLEAAEDCMCVCDTPPSECYDRWKKAAGK